MKTVELRKKNEKQLKEQLLDPRKEQFNLRFQLAGGQLQSTARIKEVRRDIAKIKTLINETKANG